MDAIDRSGYPLTNGIKFSREGKTLVLKLDNQSLVSNMQSDQSAFEGWALCVFSNNKGEYEHVRIDWTPLNKEKLSSQELGHYYRFLFRAYMFRENYPSFVEIRPSAESVLDVDEMKRWVLNFPSRETKASKKKNEDAEAHLERELLAMMDGHFNYCDHQLPVGLFVDEIHNVNARSSGKLSQIDLWSVKDGVLNIYELKNDVNEAVGIISELMFYTNVMDCFRRHIFNYPTTFPRKRIYYRHSKELYDDIVNDRIEVVNGYLLANNIHPRISDDVINLMNSNTAGIVFSKLPVNDFKSALK